MIHGVRMVGYALAFKVECAARGSRYMRGVGVCMKKDYLIDNSLFY